MGSVATTSAGDVSAKAPELRISSGEFSDWRKLFLKRVSEGVQQLPPAIEREVSQLCNNLEKLNIAYRGELRLRRLITLMRGDASPASVPDEVKGALSESASLFPGREGIFRTKVRKHLSQTLQQTDNSHLAEEVLRGVSEIQNRIKEAASLGLLPQSEADIYEQHLEDDTGRIEKLLDKSANRKTTPPDNALEMIISGLNGSVLEPLRSAAGAFSQNHYGNLSHTAGRTVSALEDWPHSSYTPAHTCVMLYTAHFHKANLPDLSRSESEAALQRKEEILDEIIREYGTRPQNIRIMVGPFEAHPGDPEGRPDFYDQAPEELTAPLLEIQAGIEEAKKNASLLQRRAGLSLEISQDIAFKVGNRAMPAVMGALLEAHKEYPEGLEAVLMSNRAFLNMPPEDIDIYLKKFADYVRENKKHFSALISCDPLRMPENVNSLRQIEARESELKLLAKDEAFKKSFLLANKKLELETSLQHHGCAERFLKICSAIITTSAWEDQSISPAVLAAAIRPGNDFPPDEVDRAVNWLTKQKVILQNGTSGTIRLRLNENPRSGSIAEKCLKAAADIAALEGRGAKGRASLSGESPAIAALARLYDRLSEIGNGGSELHKLAARVNNFCNNKGHPERLFQHFRTESQLIAGNIRRKRRRNDLPPPKTLNKIVTGTLEDEITDKAPRQLRSILSPLIKDLKICAETIKSESSKPAPAIPEAVLKLLPVLQEQENTLALRGNNINALQKHLNLLTAPDGPINELCRALEIVKPLIENGSPSVASAGKDDAYAGPEKAPGKATRNPHGLRVEAASFRVDINSNSLSARVNSEEVDPAAAHRCALRIWEILHPGQTGSINAAAPDLSSDPRTAALLEKAAARLRKAYPEMKFSTEGSTLHVTAYIELPKLGNLQPLMKELKELTTQPDCRVVVTCDQRREDLYAVLSEELGNAGASLTSLTFNEHAKTINANLPGSIRGSVKESLQDAFLKRTGWSLEIASSSPALTSLLQGQTDNLIEPLDPWVNLNPDRRPEAGIIDFVSRHLPQELRAVEVYAVENCVVIDHETKLPGDYRLNLGRRLSRIGQPIILHHRPSAEPVAFNEQEVIRIVKQSLPAGIFLREVSAGEQGVEVSLYDSDWGKNKKVIENYRRELEDCLRRGVTLHVESVTPAFAEVLSSLNPFAARMLARACNPEGKIEEDALFSLSSYISHALKAPPADTREWAHSLRSLNITERAFAVDNDNTRFREDAFEIEKTTTGWKITVHILDLSIRFPYGSAADDYARQVSYRQHDEADKISLLMLPSSSAHMGFRENDKDTPATPAWSTTFEISQGGEITSVNLGRSAVKLSRALTYKDADELLAGNGSRSGQDELNMLDDALSALRKAGGEGGSFSARGSRGMVGALLNTSDLLISEIFEARGAAALIQTGNGSNGKIDVAVPSANYGQISSIRQPARDYRSLANQHILAQFFGGIAVGQQDLQSIALERMSAEDEKLNREKYLRLFSCLRDLAAEAGYTTSLTVEGIDEEGRVLLDISGHELSGSKAVLEGVTVQDGIIKFPSGETMQVGEALAVRVSGYDAVNECFLFRPVFQGRYLGSS